MQNDAAKLSDQLASALGLWTFDMVQDRMVEAVRTWWRTPGRVGPSKGSPFASDIPAELIVREANMGDYDERGYLGTSSDVPLRPAAMTRADVDARDVASDWMAFVPESDRRLVSLALVYLARGRASVPWMQLKRDMGIAVGAGGLQRRYEKAIGSVAKALNEHGETSQCNNVSIRFGCNQV
ncbi:MAG: hypothetical protein Pars92KO_10120 [Parasphingorhabdus sp.]